MTNAEATPLLELDDQVSVIDASTNTPGSAAPLVSFTLIAGSSLVAK